MKLFVNLIGLTLAGLVVCVTTGVGASQSTPKEKSMTARGAFDVKVTPRPQSQDDSMGGPFGNLFLDKQFHGDLKATGKGQMLGAETAVKGSGAYVALELVTGTLNGKRGSFILQHQGTMRKGTYLMNITVVPDSGTEELTGIDGTMTIVIQGGTHSYEFEYTLGGK